MLRNLNGLLSDAEINQALDQILKIEEEVKRLEKFNWPSRNDAMKNFEQLIGAINTATTAEDIDTVSPAIGQWLQAGTPNQKVALQTAVSQLNARLALLTTRALE